MITIDEATSKITVVETGEELDLKGGTLTTPTGRVISSEKIAEDNGRLQFKNLIINGDFRINQRSAVSKIETASAYNYDRWFYDGTYLYTSVEDVSLFDGTFTLSWLSDATAEYQLLPITTTSADLVTTTTGWAEVANEGNFTLASTSGNHLWLRFTVGTDGFSALTEVQLESGNRATAFERLPYNVVEYQCLRYYREHLSVAMHGTSGADNGGRRNVNIIHSPSMRVDPTPFCTADNVTAAISYAATKDKTVIIFSGTSPTGNDAYAANITIDAEL